mmetsp:Transcript_98491/g.175436  ORF Transcript_98491/g.175436 Transcript_98491/m.175436 type:complete len:246 (-) Transcript_98491:1226-1963(-)
MHVWVKVKLLAQCVNKLKSHVRSLAAIGQLCYHRESVVAWLHTVELHGAQDFNTTIEHAIAGATIKDRVVRDFICSNVPTLHRFHHLKSVVQPVGGAVGLDDSTIGDDARLQSSVCHFCQHGLDSMKLTGSSTNIQQRVVDSHRGLDAILDHLTIEKPNPRELVLVVEGLDDRAVHHGVDQIPCLRLLQSLLDDLVGSFRIRVPRQGFHHAANSDASWLKLHLLHTAPGVPDTFHIMLGTICTDD